ncbi:hypothetical protein WKH15_21525 [Pantoea agglomerans]|uniref:hypothetical protein n=1 Tax=Enterobacter agglomerans TaxID=549 RepID=UPI003C79E3E9
MITLEKSAQETLQLEQRGNRLLRYGRRLLVAGASLAVICAGSWLTADWYLPRIDDFNLDIPETIYGLANELRLDFASDIQSIIGFVITILIVGFFAMAGLSGIQALTDKFKESSKTSAKIVIVVLSLLGFVGVPFACYLSWNPVSHELKAYADRDLVKGLNKKEIPPERKASWDYQYLQAQQAVLSGHADRSQLQDVLKQYSTRHIRYYIPSPVRYALEMQAFQLPLSDEARQFQNAQERKSTRWRNVSLIAFSGSCLLALAGLIASLTGKKVRSRVKFLRAIR